MYYTNDWIRALLPAELQEHVARITGLPLKSITVYNRALREAGLLTQRGRGVASPSMTPTDAARLLLAVCVASGPADAVERFSHFEAMRCQPLKAPDALSLYPFDDEGVGPVEALAMMIESIRDRTFQRHMRTLGYAESGLEEILRFAFMLTSPCVFQIQLIQISGPPLQRWFASDSEHQTAPSMTTTRYLDGRSVFSLGASLRA